MLTFSTALYRERFADSLVAKEHYAGWWGYTWEVFTEDTLRCEDFRPQRWQGDCRYCKLQALQVMWQRIVQSRSRTREAGIDYIFWHDVDTHIMNPKIPLESLVVAAGYASIIFTDNALSLNNGAFLLEVSPAGAKFLKSWRGGCRTGEWPWADNGCMYEVLLTSLGGPRYNGHCRRFREASFAQGGRPEPATGAQLMRCFNQEMAALGMGCCGSSRGIPGFAFLTGPSSAFNHHPCHELEKSQDFVDEDPATIRANCFLDGMLMVHTKNVSYARTSRKRAQKLVKSKSSAVRAEL